MERLNASRQIHVGLVYSNWKLTDKPLVEGRELQTKAALPRFGALWRVVAERDPKRSHYSAAVGVGTISVSAIISI